MKWFAVCCLTILAGVAYSASIGDVKPKEPRFIFFPDDKGVMHLVDLEDDTPPEVKFEPDADIFYLLFTRKNPLVGQRIYKNDTEALAETNFDPSKPVKITIHGWTGDYTDGTNTYITNAFLKASDVNMITVDWSKGSSGGYSQSVRNVPGAGKSVGEFLDWLNILGVPFSKMHLMGHSLGGQMAAFASRLATRGKVEILTGLDPAGPSWGPDSGRISPADALYVEIIHSNSGILGQKDAVGDNDFYTNGGVNMPGCDGNIYCSHSRSWEYMADSIDHEMFVGQKCLNTAEALNGNCSSPTRLYMGGSKIKSAVGVLSLETNAQPPYYQGPPAMY